MSTYKITFSPTGGTQKVADILTEGLSGQSRTIDLLKDISEVSFSADDLCVIALPAFGGRIPSICEQRMERLNGNGAKAVLVAVFGNRAIDDTLLEMKDLVLARGFVPVAAVEAVAEHSILRQFAAGRPDETDKAELLTFAGQIGKILEEGVYSKDLAVPGNRPYRERGKGGMKPVADSTCNSCGICVWKCPVRAIPKEDPKSADKETCISCMRCIAVCPRKARKLDEQMLAVSAKKMGPICSGRKGNKLYI